jgi:hypothetical protein
MPGHITATPLAARHDEELHGESNDDLAGVFTHWVDFVAAVLPQMVAFAPGSIATLVRCFADILYAVAGATPIPSGSQPVTAPPTWFDSTASALSVASARPAVGAHERVLGGGGQGTRPLVRGLTLLLTQCLALDMPYAQPTSWGYKNNELSQNSHAGFRRSAQSDVSVGMAASAPAAAVAVPSVQGRPGFIGSMLHSVASIFYSQGAAATTPDPPSFQVLSLPYHSACC